MKTYFLDTSALVKLYHQEKGTGEVEKIFSTEDATIIISEIAVVELYSALYKLNRMKEISKDAVEASTKSFEEDCKYRFSINPVSADEIDRAKEIIKRYGEEESVRTLDAIQLAVALDNENTVICNSSVPPPPNPLPPGEGGRGSAFLYSLPLDGGGLGWG